MKMKAFKSQLLQYRETLVGNLRRSTAELIDDDSSYTDSIDQASADVDKSFLLQMKNRDRDLLLQVDEALRRIESGEYGECEQCGESISEARMKAFPLTTLCIDCKAELESPRGARHGSYSY